MTFLAGSRLWLLPAVLVVAAAYVVTQLRRREYAVRFTNLALLDTVAPRRPGWRRHLPAAAFVLALTALVAAFARPSRPVKVPRERATVMMAVDVSLSMEATDVPPSRILAAVDAAMDFVDRVPPRLNLGLVVFSGGARLVVPPTTDHTLVKEGLGRVQLGTGTAIGEAVFASLEAIAGLAPAAGEAPAPARIVLMSDGETVSGRPNTEAAAAARDARVPVSTIAFGTDSGVITSQGQSLLVPVNRPALQELALATGGSAFEAATADELAHVYADIGSQVGYRTRQREVTSWFVGTGLALALAAAAGSLVWSSRLP